ncbi:MULTISPECIES: hypothetical protein [Serratia]|uniref:hypothetical protein n=1 Tax=Serratia TaxID=613 RepID=UPI0006CAFBF5|nr:hypothetical protein [Serratia marcescens]ALE98566.1 hypothetical protein ABH11_04313 [Serratia marcescens]MBI6149254.1 hypothetical protein [Serratia marcescens]HEJ6938525.1 hypothetical protein [Serratia marcescens]HEJ7846220.1 hypothetical protein [Serratia marcescens]
MNIEFSIDDQEFDQERKDLLKKTLKIEDKDIQDALNKIAKASLSEYIIMLVEGGMPNRADEAKQDRLLYLIKSYFCNNLPTESQISTIFQLTQSQSKTLLKNTVSRFRHKLEAVLNETMKSVIETAEHSNEIFLVVINSDVVKDELNMLITQNEPTFKPIAKRKGSAGQFEISEDSHNLLRRELGLNEVE